MSGFFGVYAYTYGLAKSLEEQCNTKLMNDGCGQADLVPVYWQSRKYNYCSVFRGTPIQDTIAFLLCCFIS